jgi:hypothetical protein
MTHRRPKKIGVVDSVPLNGSVFHLWQCADWGGYFAAAERSRPVWVVGLAASSRCLRLSMRQPSMWTVPRQSIRLRLSRRFPQARSGTNQRYCLSQSGMSGSSTAQES